LRDSEAAGAVSDAIYTCIYPGKEYNSADFDEPAG